MRRSAVSSRSWGQLGPAVRLLLLCTIVLGLAYPLAVTGIAQVLFPAQSNGSLVHREGTVVGSSLVGQTYTGDAYFHGRPSAAGDGYDPLSTSASNLALDNPELVRDVRERRAAAAKADGTEPRRVAPDALLASGSGLDPQISPEYAGQQVARVARARGLPDGQVRAMVATYTKGRTLGFLGEPRVDLLELNLALDRAG
jgi:potassium-transporting ATPase KdpC subunit